MNNIYFIILGYLCIGLVLVLWDFRKSLFGSQEGTYLDQPNFLENLTISTAAIFVIIWPYKLFKKNIR